MQNVRSNLQKFKQIQGVREKKKKNGMNELKVSMRQNENSAIISTTTTSQFFEAATVA